MSSSTTAPSESGEVAPARVPSGKPRTKPAHVKRYSAERRGDGEKVWSAKGQSVLPNAGDKPKTQYVRRIPSGHSEPAPEATTQALTQQLGESLNINDERGQQQYHSGSYPRKPRSSHRTSGRRSSPSNGSAHVPAEENRRGRDRRDHRAGRGQPDLEMRARPRNRAGVETGDRVSLAEFHAEGHEAREEDVPSRILWVGNIGPEVSEDEMRQEFSAFGKIESLRILHDRYCAFVNFEDENCAKKAKKELQGMIFGSQYIVINYRKPEAKHPVALSMANSSVTTEDNFILNNPSRALWIGNISGEVGEQDLLSEFEQFGQIESIRLLRDRTCAFVNFMSIEEATNALYALQGKPLGNMAIKINFGKPQHPPKRVAAMDPGMLGFQTPYMGPGQPYFSTEYPYPMPFTPYPMQPPFMGAPMDYPNQYYMHYQQYYMGSPENGIHEQPTFEIEDDQQANAQPEPDAEVQ